MASPARGTLDVTQSVIVPPSAPPSAPRRAPDAAASDAAPLVGTERYLIIEGSDGPPSCTARPDGDRALVRAYDTRLGREVALEWIPIRSELDDSHGSMLGAAQAMARLSHPNVLALYDAVLRGDAVMLAMEHAPGSTVARWLTEAGPSWRQIVRVFVDAGRGLAAAHAAGLSHGHFDARSVLIGRDGRVRVTGFRLAQGEQAHADAVDPAAPELRRGMSETALAQDCGAPHSAGAVVPGHEEGESAGQATDQHAFCAALWAALTGAPTHPGSPRAATRVSPAEKLGARAPRAVRQALQRGLDPLPSERWPALGDLLDVLERQIAPQRRAALFATGVAALAGAALVGAWEEQRSRLCSGAEEHLQTAWGPERRAAVEQRMRDSELVYAEDAWRLVQPRLDAYASAWTGMHLDTCEATTVRDEQPADVMDLRMACLQHARVRLQAVTDLLAVADAQVIERVDRIASGLPPLERCADVESLRIDVEPPLPSDREAVEAVRAELAKVSVQRDAGKLEEARAAVVTLANRAAAVGYRPLQAEVWLERGMVEEELALYFESENALRLALRTGLQSKQWAEACHAASVLVAVIGKQGRASEALAYAATAEGLLELDGGGGGGGGEAILRNSIGLALEMLGRSDEAEQAYRDALASYEQTATSDGELSAPRIRGNLANIALKQGRYAEGERGHRAVLAERERRLGPLHPDVALTRFFIAWTLFRQARYDEAEQELAAATSVFERVTGPASPRVAMCSLLSAEIAFNRRDLPKAEREARATLELHRDVYGPEHLDVAATHQLLGNILHASGRYEECEPEYRRALAIRQKVLGPNHPLIADARTGIALAIGSLGRFREAEAEYRAILQLQQRLLPAGDLQLSQTRINIANMLVRQNRHVEAEVEVRAALAQLLATLGAEDLSVARARAALANVLAGQKRFAEAQELAAAALLVEEKLLGAEHRFVVSLRQNLKALRAAAAGKKYEQPRELEPG